MAYPSPIRHRPHRGRCLRLSTQRKRIVYNGDEVIYVITGFNNNLLGDKHMAQVISLSKEGGAFTVDVYIVNPNERFAPFGGSRGGLMVKKTASLITRVKDPQYGIKDTEYDVCDPSIWKWIDELVNWHGYKMTATQPIEDQSEPPQAAA